MSLDKVEINMYVNKMCIYMRHWLSQTSIVHLLRTTSVCYHQNAP